MHRELMRKTSYSGDEVGPLPRSQGCRYEGRKNNNAAEVLVRPRFPSNTIAFRENAVGIPVLTSDKVASILNFVVGRLFE